MIKSNLVILTTRNLAKAPRIHREIEALKNNYNLFLFGEGDQKMNYTKYYNFYAFRSLKDKIQNGLVNKIANKIGFNIQRRFKRFERFIRENDVKILIIHEDLFLPLASIIKKKYGVKLVFNAHEYHPLEFEDVAGWLQKEGALHYRLYRTYLHQIDLLINVSDGIRDKCLNEFGKDSIVIPNAPYLSETNPIINNSPTIRMIHHGALLPSRKIEQMIEITEKLGQSFSLDIMGVINDFNRDYYDSLNAKTINIPNVKFIPAVEYEEIIPFINSYDVGLYLLPPINFNNQHALPNKFFEFMHANLVVAISPNPEMKRIVEKHQIGVVAKEFTVESMVEAISHLDREKIEFYKKNTENAAKIENAEHYQKIFLNQIVSLG